MIGAGVATVVPKIDSWGCAAASSKGPVSILSAGCCFRPALPPMNLPQKRETNFPSCFKPGLDHLEFLDANLSFYLYEYRRGTVTELRRTSMYQGFDLHCLVEI